MATALEAAAAPALAREVADWVRALGGEALDTRSRILARVEHEDEVSPYAATAIAAPDAETRTVLVTQTGLSPRSQRGYRWVVAAVAMGLLAGVRLVRHQAGAASMTVTETAAIEPVLPLAAAVAPATPGEPGPLPSPPSPAPTTRPMKHPAQTTTLARSHASVATPTRKPCPLRTIDANGITRYHPECAAPE
jgi:hypothetical protein